MNQPRTSTTATGRGSPPNQIIINQNVNFYSSCKWTQSSNREYKEQAREAVSMTMCEFNEIPHVLEWRHPAEHGEGHLLCIILLQRR